MRSENVAIPYGLTDIDPAVVKGYRKKDPSVIDRASEGGIASPLRSHSGRWLKWMGGDYTKGSEFHSEPGITIRASGTYIYQDPLNNFIAGQRLIHEALSGKWKKAETGRLGYENSEDALTWNVFRSLQESNGLRRMTEAVGIPHVSQEPKLYLWGRRIELETTEAWPRLQELRNQLEPGKGQQTEPDAVLHVPQWGWIFFESKFGSRTDTYARTPERVHEWFKRYSCHCPDAFDTTAIGKIAGKEFPAQILRNIAFADRIRASDENAVVVALVRKRDSTAIESWVQRCLTTSCGVRFLKLTWEELCASLPAGEPGADLIRRYMLNKTIKLGAAFDLPAIGYQYAIKRDTSGIGFSR